MKQTRHPLNPEAVNDLIRTAHEHGDMVGWIVVVPAQRQPEDGALAVDCIQAWNLHPLDVAQLLDIEAEGMREKFQQGGTQAFAVGREAAEAEFEAQNGRKAGH